MYGGCRLQNEMPVLKKEHVLRMDGIHTIISYHVPYVVYAYLAVFYVEKGQETMHQAYSTVNSELSCGMLTGQLAGTYSRH